MLIKVMILIAIVFLSTLDFVMMIPLGPMIAIETGLGIENANLFIAIYALFTALSGVFIAGISDGVSRKALLMTLLVILGGASIGSAMSTQYQSLFFFRSVAGLSGGILMPTAIAYAGDQWVGNARVKAVTWILLAIPIASTLGVPLSAWVSESYGWESAFGVIGLLSIFLTILSSNLEQHNVNQLDSKRFSQITEFWLLWRAPRLRQLFVIELFLVTITYSFVPHLGAWLTLNFSMSVIEIGNTIFIGGLGAVFGNIVAGYSVRSGARVKPIVIGTLTLALTVSFAVSEWAPQSIIAVLMFLIMAGDAGRYPSIQVLLTERSTQLNRGKVLLMNIVITNVGMAAGALWTSPIVKVQAGQLTGLYTVSAGVTVISVVVLILLLGVASKVPAALKNETR